MTVNDITLNIIIIGRKDETDELRRIIEAIMRLRSGSDPAKDRSGVVH